MSPLDNAQVPDRLTTLRIAVLVAGGVAAYKVADLVSLLTQSGAEVRVAMTRSAQRFVGAPTFQAVSGKPVLTDLWPAGGEAEPHVALGDWAQVALVAPATANVLSRLARGAGDDIVTATALAARCPIVLAPAMNDAMWAKPVVATNVETLRNAGFVIVFPERGRLASGHRGAGRLAANAALLAGLESAIESRYDMAGLRVVVSAGGTREPIDPVRFISNYSSGKMGFAAAAAAADRGAQVALISTAPHPRHAGVDAVEVETADEMLSALRAAIAGADLLVMAAAVADYRPASRADAKMRREDAAKLTLELERNVDILAALASDPAADGVFRVGFAAETGEPVVRAREKLARKKLDAIVANDVSREDTGFGSDFNAGVLILSDGREVELPRQTKREMADRVLDAVLPRLRARQALPGAAAGR